MVKPSTQAPSAKVAQPQSLVDKDVAPVARAPQELIPSLRLLHPGSGQALLPSASSIMRTPNMLPDATNTHCAEQVHGRGSDNATAK